MRHGFALASVMIACWFAIPATSALAQGGGRGGGQGGPSAEDEAAKKKKAEEWSPGNLAPLPGKKNAGPCPYVKVLYDAARYVEFKDNKVAIGQVGYTGEIENLTSGCKYGAKDPIHVEIELLFGFGRGPQAEGASKAYSYWVAVTDRNNDVLAKESFGVVVNFAPGEDHALVTDRINGITIPRAGPNVSGSNFEVLVGFEVTPEMADFNRQGKRFRINAASALSAASAPASPTSPPKQ